MHRLPALVARVGRGARHDSRHETIKWELWKVAYGVWNHIKNSGKFPEAETLTLEWVGTIPGKRESRRFEGDYMIIQQDLVEQRQHPDAVSFGGWAIDLHPSRRRLQRETGCQQWHSKGVLPDSVSQPVFAEHQKSFPRRPHHQRVAHRVRFDARDGDVRAQVVRRSVWRRRFAPRTNGSRAICWLRRG
jgi:hypothetical protein